MKNPKNEVTEELILDSDFLENLVNINWILNINELKVTFITPNIKNLVGYSANEIINKPLNETFLSPSVETIQRSIERNILNKKTSTNDLYIEVIRVQNKNGKIFPIEIVFQQRVNSNNIPHYHGYIRNRQVNNSSLKRFLNQEDKLLESLKKNNQIISILAHDLRGPLGNLNELIRLVIDNFDSYDSIILKKLLNSISVTTNNTYQLMDNLVAWAKTHRNEGEYILEHNNLLKIITEEVELYSSILKQKSLRVAINIPEHLSAKCHKETMSIVIRNLLSNAIKFSQPEGEIIFKSSTQHNKVEISISDYGVGIPSNLQSKILDPNEKVSKPGTNNENGTGLGLTLCKELVEKNKGNIWFESAENMGTTFYISLLSQ